VFKSNKSIVNITLVITSLIFALCLVEVVLRLIGFDYPTWQRLNESTGTEHYPGAEGWNRDEGENYIKINRDGMRGPLYPKTKPGNVFRVAVIGDSFAEGYQVPLENTFSNILEKDLNKCKPYGEKKIEVLNFGIGDHGTANELFVLRTQAWLYEPDIVLLAFFSGNDIRNNSKVLEPQKIRPFFTLQNGDLILDDSFKRTKAFKFKTSSIWKGVLWLSTYSRTVQFLNKVRHRAGASKESRSRYNFQMQLLEDDIFSEPKKEKWQEAWKITESLIARMNEEVQQRGAQFLIATLSIGIQVHPDINVRNRFMEKAGVNNLYYPDNRIKNLAEKNKIPHVILAHKFAAYAKRTGEFLHGFERTGTEGVGHWNENGHRMGGHLISEKMCKGNIF
jgi:hypothetical protein